MEWLKVKSEDLMSIVQEYIEAEKITFQAYKATLKMKLPIYIENLLRNELEETYSNVLKVIEYVRDKFGSGSFTDWNSQMMA